MYFKNSNNRVIIKDYYADIKNQQFTYWFSDGTILSGDDMSRLLAVSETYNTAYKQAVLFAQAMAECSETGTVSDSVSFGAYNEMENQTEQLWTEG